MSASKDAEFRSVYSTRTLPFLSAAQVGILTPSIAHAQVPVVLAQAGDAQTASGPDTGQVEGKHDLLVPTADGVKEPQNRRVQIVYSGGALS